MPARSRRLGRNVGVAALSDRRQGSGKLDAMKSVRPVRRTIDRFLADPASIRIAAWLIVGSTLITVVAGGAVIRVFDRREFPNMGRALWFTLQTVTTVGYGDVTPHRIVGRLVAAVVMVAGIGFLTIVTAAVTSVFIEASRRRGIEPPEARGEIGDIPSGDIATVNRRLDQIEQTLVLLVEQTRPR
jgi:voltage-gated potassium channel